MSLNVLNYFQQPGEDNDNELIIGGSMNVTGTVDFSSATVTQEGVSAGQVFSLINTVTLAEVNAGKTILAGASGAQIVVHGFRALVSGNFAAGTTVDLEDSNGTPIVVANFAQAQLTDGALLNEPAAGVTLGAGFLGALTAGAGLVVTKTGSDFTGGTSITFQVLYSVA